MTPAPPRFRGGLLAALLAAGRPADAAFTCHIPTAGCVNGMFNVDLCQCECVAPTTHLMRRLSFRSRRTLHRLPASIRRRPQVHPALLPLRVRRVVQPAVGRVRQPVGGLRAGRGLSLGAPRPSSRSVASPRKCSHSSILLPTFLAFFLHSGSTPPRTRPAPRDPR